ncbi:MAG: AraC family transcriptional regulator [Firmicutes bacterium]|nr:AraC family transcriptional regulator [Bacillota bacterium]
MLSYYSDKNFDIFEIKKCLNVMQSEKPHFHHELSIALIDKGGTSVRFGKKTYNFTAKDLIIFSPGLVHCCIPYSLENWGFTMIYLDYGWVKGIFKLEFKENEVFSCKLSKDEYLRLKNNLLFLEKRANYISKKKCLITILEKYLIQNMEKFNNIKIDLLEKERIKRVREYIEDNINQKVTLDKLSDISGISKYHLMRTFKKMYKVSPLTYQRNLRFNLAKKGLKEGGDISKIAVSLGYYDQSHFTNEFKKFSGTTPDDYRKNLCI